MSRARRAGPVALPIALVLALATASLVAAARRPDGTVAGGDRLLSPPSSWPTSTLLISEVETGGASASDELVELTNAGASPVDLMGLEVVYATSTGSTVTRKATWAASTDLDPGRHLLIANAAGIHASHLPTRRTRRGSRRQAARWCSGRSAGTRSTRSRGATPPTRSWRHGRARHRLPDRASSGCPADRPATAIDTNVNAADFVGRGRRRHRTWPRRRPPARRQPSRARPRSRHRCRPPFRRRSATPMPTPAQPRSRRPVPSPASRRPPHRRHRPDAAPPTPRPDAEPDARPDAADDRRSPTRGSMPDGATRHGLGRADDRDLGAIDSGRIGFVQDATGGIAVRLAAARDPAGSGRARS